MNEQEARRIWSSPEDRHSYDECVACDRWIKEYAMRELKHKLRTNAVPKAIAEFVIDCAQAHFGAVETDKMLQEMLCYPHWMYRDSPSKMA